MKITAPVSTRILIYSCLYGFLTVISKLSILFGPSLSYYCYGLALSGLASATELASHCILDVWSEPIFVLLQMPVQL